MLAVADELRSRHPEARLTVLGTQEGLESTLVPARGYPMAVVPRVPLPRRPGADLLSVPRRLRAAVAAASRAITENEAQVVVGFGGYVSTPAYLAARRLGVPVVIHEQNARPGLANKLGARWARSVAVTFPGTPLRGGIITGLPLRREIADLVRAREENAAKVRREAAAVLGIDPDRRTLLVTGGSLGAQSLNDAMTRALDDVAASDAQVLHLTGNGKSEALTDALEQRPALAGRYHVREYLEDMHLALAACDVVLCRSGAGTVAELTALGLPAVYVPLPIGNGEQRLNALPAVHAGGGLLVDDAEVTPDWVSTQLLTLLADEERVAQMAEAAARVGRVGAAADVADLVERAAGEA
ncbi:undecaprenyldiphospho-muramoylpentapeptide beta-N-acetylglucosaminyltransferase [Flavimobilis soli]|nr:undecaprenyldiphospho-muramoylpentapeptide beta-N-acetylglucosaminyltransferase [Flavimobilis soli]